jgi:hypothetical protein
LQNGGNSPQKKLGDIINIYFIFFKKLDKVYNGLNDLILIFSNKFDFGIFYVFNVGIIKINLKLLFIRSNLFSLKFLISSFWQFFLEFALFFPFFPQQQLPS